MNKLLDHESNDTDARPVSGPSRAEVLALGVRTDLVTACRIVYGSGKNRAWDMYHAGQLDFPALKCGRKVIVPVAPLLKLLGLEDARTGG